jgi:FkbM family methyltransferase
MAGEPVAMIASLARATADAKRIVHAFLRRFGFDIVRYDDAFGRLARLLAERNTGLALDVGANDGAYVRALRAGGYRGRVVSFEPLSEAYRRLHEAAVDDPLWQCIRLALGADTGNAELHVAGNSSSSSLLPMTEHHRLGAPESAYVGSERVAVAPLDSFWGELWQPGERIFLKLDVQGYEGQVLEGATKTLADVHVLQCELSLVPLYEGQSLLTDVVERLGGVGFELASLDSVFRDPRSGRLLQVDGLFVRSRS